MSAEDSNEIFELCNDIQSLVAEGSHSLEFDVESTDKLDSVDYTRATKTILMDLPDEILDSMNPDSNSSPLETDRSSNSDDFFSLFDTDYSSSDSKVMDNQIFTDLFPALVTL